jgi:coenzyme PQQ precursor peptide PqqA
MVHQLTEGARMTWSKPEFEIVELGMEVGAYAGNA